MRVFRPALATVGLIAVLVVCLSGTSAAVAPRIHARTTTATAQKGGQARVQGATRGIRPGTRLTMGERYTAGGGWVVTGSTRVDGHGRFDWHETVHTSKSRFYRACLRRAGRSVCSGRVEVRIVASHAGSRVLLGLANTFLYGEGFGTVRPSTVFNGGDPTGLFTKIGWSSWGGRHADGTGVGNWTPSDGDVADSYPQPLRLRAFDRTTCGGHVVYRRLAVWFPTHGETFETAGEASYDLCQTA